MVGGILSDGSIPLFAAGPDLEEHPHRPASAIVIITGRRVDVMIEAHRFPTVRVLHFCPPERFTVVETDAEGYP